MSTENHKHKWMVYSSSVLLGYLMVWCDYCGAYGEIRDVSSDEMYKWFIANTYPAEWKGGDERVVITESPGDGE